MTITGTDADRTSLELNRWLDSAYRIPSADKPGYLSVLAKLIEKKNIEGVFPQPDSEVRIISSSSTKIRARTFLPSESSVAACLDKYESLQRWHKAGLRSSTIVFGYDGESNGDLDSSLRKLTYPCWTRARQGAGGLMSCLASDWKVLSHWMRFHWDQGIKADFLVEEYLPGRDFCFMSIWNHGSLITSMVRERLSWLGQRTIGTGGTSRLNRVVHSEEANKVAERSILTITDRPHGIFCVDMKGDDKNHPKPTEINCRFTTNVHYLTLASVKYGRPEWNFPWLAGRLMLGETIPACEKFDALPSNLAFTKNVDMGYTIIENDNWRAVDIY